MKRSQQISLHRMRKRRPAAQQAVATQQGLAKPLTVAVAATGLTACGGSNEGAIYSTISDCVADNPMRAAQCEAAYEQALARASRSGPRYDDLSSCEYDFGYANCEHFSPSVGAGVFVPLVAGFALSRFWDDDDYDSMPLYTSFSKRSRYYKRWASLAGHDLGRIRYGRYNLSRSLFKPVPATTRTLRRGGFGGQASAKSGSGFAGASRGFGG